MGREKSEEAPGRETALAELRRFGIRGPNVYLIDLIPLIEMVWADGRAQPAELDHLETFVRFGPEEKRTHFEIIESL